MAVQLSRTFVIENEWYWRINESATSLTVESALRDFIAPLLRTLKSGEARPTDAGFELVFGDSVTAIALTQHATDKIALNHLVGDINRALSSARLGVAFALVVPKRYELRGAVLADSELAALSGDPMLIIPSSRASWQMAVPHT
jgi:hypothetical protein